MPFVPHTRADVAAMLEAIGVTDIEALFREIPASLRDTRIDAVPEGLSECEVSRLMRARAAQDRPLVNFIGAGAYEHHIPAAVWELTTRGEFYTAYTPYQAEASQGTLQLLYEYQSMMAGLMALDVSNASLYDGASALAEAVLMAVRANRKCPGRRVVMPSTVHPRYRSVVRTIVASQGIELAGVPYDRERGVTDLEACEQALGAAGGAAALVIPMPNFFGQLEDVDALCDLARRHRALVIGLVNPLGCAVLKPPGEWGQDGADIACGEGQPLGIPLSSGGPYFGFLCCRKAWVRQMPGRLVGQTVDADGKRGFALTLQAREQHIRRSKATSNICTNQGLMVTAATIYMTLLGSQGLADVVAAAHGQCAALRRGIEPLDTVTVKFPGPCLHELVLDLGRPVATVYRELLSRGILAGYPLGPDYPELDHCLLTCVTETKTDEQITQFIEALDEALKAAA